MVREERLELSRRWHMFLRHTRLPVPPFPHMFALRSASHISFPNSYTTFQSICSSGRSFISRRPRTTDLSRYHHIDNLASTVNSDFQQDGNQPHLCFLHYLTSGFIARMCPYYLHCQLTTGGPCRARTYDTLVNSQVLYQLS